MAEVTTPEVPADEGTLRERLQAELDGHEYDGDNHCACGAPWDIDGRSDGYVWTMATNRHFAELMVAALATELQKSRAEVAKAIEDEVRMIPCYGGRGQSEFDIPGSSHRETVLHVIGLFAGGAS